MDVQKSNFIYTYRHSQVHYSIWANLVNGSVQTIVFLGVAQIERLAQWVAESCPPGTLVVQGAPHWHASNDGSDLHTYMEGFVTNVFDILLEQFHIDEVHIVAESQAVPGVIKILLLKKYNSHLKKLTLLQPLGLNKRAFTESTGESAKTLQKRIVANMRYQLIPMLTDGRLRYNHRLLHRVTGIHTKKARAQYNVGLTYDATDDLLQLYAITKNIIIICGEKDKLFSPHEIKNNLANHKIAVRVHVVKNVPHSPLATKHGQKLLHEAFVTSNYEDRRA